MSLGAAIGEPIDDPVRKMPEPGANELWVVDEQGRASP